jgi:isocitrate dehydrogenase
LEKLLNRIRQTGIEWVKVENLYNFDGKPGFSRGQGQ